MSKDFQQELRKVLRKHAEYHYDSIEGFGSMHTMSLDEATEAITKLIEEQVIGEDEVRMNPSGNTHKRTVQNRNQLRAGQRAIVRAEQ